uniref:Putative secreted protein n=1 Tax=Anopheles marajoara TaxID=58244 RepID=A0A2M4CEG8_9DIPT
MIAVAQGWLTISTAPFHSLALALCISHSPILSPLALPLLLRRGGDCCLLASPAVIDAAIVDVRARECPRE